MKDRTLIVATALCTYLGAVTAGYAAQLSTSDAQLQGQTLTLNVTAPQDGWAVIHKKSSDGSTGAHIGHSQIKSGENSKVKISLDQPVQGSELILMLHKDAGKKGTFEFGAGDMADAPVMENGKPLTTPVNVK